MNGGPIGPTDCIIHAAPLSHATGLFSLSHLAMASNQIIPESQGANEEEIFGLVTHYANVTVFAAPTFLNRLTQHPDSASIPLDHLKSIIYGGAPTYLEDLKRALSRFGCRLIQGYGQGETPNTISFLSKAAHADTGGEISRDEVPLAYQQYVQQYFEEIRKLPVAGAKAGKKTVDSPKKAGSS